MRALRREIPSPALHAVVRRVVNALRIDNALVTLVGADDQFIEAAANVPEEFGGGTPASWSFCRTVCESGVPLMVADATLDPRFRDNPVVQHQLLRSYVGAPVNVPGIGCVGALCALGGHVRTFDDGDLGVLEMAAQVVATELAKRLSTATPMIAAERSYLPQPARSLVGEKIDGRWQIMGPLGSGGQAAVYSAREIGSGARVAVKIGHAGARHSVLDEAQDLARRRHPNLVRVHAAGRMPDDRSYLVMDFVEGRSLVEHAAGGLAPPDAVRILSELAGALTALHGVGLLHGDVKPQNVLYARAEERAILIDLGLGLRLGEPGDRGGTPGWSAPEQFDADFAGELDTSVDTYGLAGVAFFLFSGIGPFSHLPPLQRVGAQATGEIGRLPERLGAVRPLLHRALSPTPSFRYRTPLELAVALDTAVREVPVLRERDATGEPRSYADVVRAIRAVTGRTPGADEAVLARLRPDERAEIVAAGADPSLPTSALVAYLRAWGDRAAVRELAEVVARHAARQLANDLKVTFDPTSMAQALPGMLARSHPWTRASVTLGESVARVRLHLPLAWRDVMEPWFAGGLSSLYARAGYRLATAWTPLDEEVEELALGWTLGG